MEKKDIIQELILLFQQNMQLPELEIRGESRLIEDLGCTSFDLMLLLPMIEKKFGIEFSIRSLRNIITLDEMAEYIKNETRH